jgi:putative two-component system response regulator
MKNIFVVDDNRINLLMAEEVLSDDYNVITMISAATMYELLQDIVPDLILLDIMMPEIDGFAALKWLKENQRCEDIPVVFLTSKNDDETRALGLKMGATDFITKPFSDVDLQNRVKAITNI